MLGIAVPQNCSTGNTFSLKFSVHLHFMDYSQMWTFFSCFGLYCAAVNIFFCSFSSDHLHSFPPSLLSGFRPLPPHYPPPIILAPNTLSFPPGLSWPFSGDLIKAAPPRPLRGLWAAMSARKTNPRWGFGY